MKLQHIKKKLSLCLIIILGVIALNPGIPTQAFERNLYDQDGDSIFTLEDEKILLNAIVNNTATTGPSLDINVDGHVGVEDLYLLCAFVEPVGYPGPFVYEGYHEPVIDVYLQTETKADTFEVQVKFNNPDLHYGYFDYAIMYDRKKLQVKDIQWSIDFQYHIRPETNNYTKQDMGDYAILAGYINRLVWNTHTETLATITFSYLDEEKQPGEVELIKNASKFDDTLELLKGYLKEPSVLCGDMNGNEQIDLDDALLMLRAALSIDRVEQSEIKSKHLDTDHDGELTLWDAATVLRIALNIEHPTYDYSDPYS